ncbi:lysophospholipid acyltransferase family protein [Hydrogenimonas sp.]
MRKRLLRRLALWIVPPLGWVLMWFLYLTNKKRWHLEGAVPETPVVVAFWHGELLMAPFIYRRYFPGRTVNVMISDHFDGELIARTIGFFGMRTIRGSSSKGAAKALIRAIRTIREEKMDVAITPDGPKGPRHSVSDGLVAIAQKAKVPIVIFNYRPSRFMQARSWDRFLIPKPFGTIDFFCSEPIDISGMAFEEARTMLAERMLHHAL